MIIRELMLPQDQPWIWEGIAALYQELFDADAMPDAVARAQIEAQWQSYADQHWAFGAFDSEQLIGFFTLAQSFALFANGPYGIINELWVHADHRSAGLGRRLLHAIEAFARQKGWARVDVSTPVEPRWDRSYQFYRNNGYWPTGHKLKLPISPQVRSDSAG